KKSFIRDGFTSYEALIPDLETIHVNVQSFMTRLENIEEEIKSVEARFKKLDELAAKGNIAETAVKSKKREYETLLLTIKDKRETLIKGIPKSLELIEQLNDVLNQNIEELAVDAALDASKKKELDLEKKRLLKIQKNTQTVAKKLSKIADIEFKKEEWVKPDKKTKQKIVATPEPRAAPIQTEIPTVTHEPTRPPPGEDIWIKWKGITIGKLIGDINITGSNYGVIATNRPSLAIIRDIAVVGPSRLRSSSNPKVIEERLQQLIMDSYGVDKEQALYPENVVKYTIEKKIGIDLLKLINSYFASVPLSAINYINNQPILNQNSQVLTLAENAGLLGRRVLAPDRSLVGVVHELYFDPTSLELYTFAFKGVPPPIIRKIYLDTHNRSLSEGNFSNFRNEISKKLSIPIYEALTPSSMIRYCLLSGQIANMNQLVTVVDSMNPRKYQKQEIYLLFHLKGYFLQDFHRTHYQGSNISNFNSNDYVERELFFTSEHFFLYFALSTNLE
ncbi:MAG: hypothetical protein ACTSPM_09525, partial [Candidatus Heimdallarchaeota archaeon]